MDEDTNQGHGWPVALEGITMGKVYRVGSVHGTTYYNTAKEADRCKPGGEEPESVICLDAAAECNRLDRYNDAAERLCSETRKLLDDLMCVCPAKVVYYTELGYRLSKFVEENPLPSAGNADRDGQRSYGH